eukprot:1079925-Alexandrium_andersonii.AAC.1
MDFLVFARPTQSVSASVSNSPHALCRPNTYLHVPRALPQAPGKPLQSLHSCPRRSRHVPAQLFGR